MTTQVLNYEPSSALLRAIVTTQRQRVLRVACCVVRVACVSRVRMCAPDHSISLRPFSLAARCCLWSPHTCTHKFGLFSRYLCFFCVMCVQFHLSKLSIDQKTHTFTLWGYLRAWYVRARVRACASVCMCERVCVCVLAHTVRAHVSWGIGLQAGKLCMRSIKISHQHTTTCKVEGWTA